VLCLVCIGNIALASSTNAPTINEVKGGVTDILKSTSYQKLNPGGGGLKEYLAEMAVKYGKNYYLLYKVIDCESNWNKDAKNPDSSASGLAQFLDGTWRDNCEGAKDNPFDQIKCLVIQFPSHPNWWSESEHCWQEWKRLIN
jgi:hypothetical protein